MTCQETQASIMAFIEDTLPKEDTIPFIDHVTSCSECMDELEVYYIMMSGMKELDQGVQGNTDFRQALLDELDERYEKIELENERSNLLLIVIFALMLITIIVGGFLFLFS